MFGVMRIAKVNNYVTIGSAKTCNLFEREDHQRILHICGPTDKTHNCIVTKENNPCAANTILSEGGDLIFVWHEGVEPINENIILRLMDHMRGGKWFIHCTAGTHRAPTPKEERTITGFQYHELKLIQNLK